MPSPITSIRFYRYQLPTFVSLKTFVPGLRGIIISTKPGQANPQVGMSILQQLEEKGKSGVLLYTDEVFPEKLLDFVDLEVFVDTACPRLALDDPERFPKPILTRDEIMVAVGTWTWEQLLERGLVRL